MSARNPTDEDVERAVAHGDQQLAVDLLREQVKDLRSRMPVQVSVDIDDEKIERMIMRKLSETVGDDCTLRVHANHRDIVESEDVVPGPGLETISVADDLGRKLQVEAMAWGCGADLASELFQVTGDRPIGTPDTFASVAPLDASKTYLLVIVEHPDEAICG